MIFYTHFYSIFCRSREIQCFLYTVAAVTKIWNIRVAFDTKNYICNSDISTFGYSSHSVQKAPDFSTSAKNRIKVNLENQDFRLKCWLVWPPEWLELSLSILPLQPLAACHSVPVHNKNFTENGNNTFFLSPNIVFFLLLVKKMIF